jgi:hypothetical protein
MNSRVGWKTWSAFALILGCGVFVFAFLPKWVSERPIETLSPVTPDAPAVELPEAPSANAEPPVVVERPVEDPEPAPAPSSSIPVGEAEEPAEPGADGFAAAMTEALEALKRDDFALAREAFARAKSFRPEAPEVASGLSQVEEGLRNRAIAGHRDRGLELEGLECFRAAEAEYDSALALDPTLRFAREGKARSSARALLLEKLEFPIAHPERLSDARALEEASRFLDEARNAEGEGPKRREAIAKLEALVASYSRPMEVSIVSDSLTDVTLNRIGRLGKFDRRVLEIRPGRYVAVGTRQGYRDVRIEFTVEPGKPLAPIQVRCEEAI